MANDTTPIVIVVVVLGILSIFSSVAFGLWWWWSTSSPSPVSFPPPAIVLAPYTEDPSPPPAPSQGPAAAPAPMGYPFGGKEFLANFYTTGDENEKNGTERVQGSLTKEECAMAAKEKGKSMVWNVNTKECWAKHVNQSSLFVGQKVIKSAEWITVTFDPYFDEKNIDSLI